MTHETILTNARIVTPEGVVHGSVRVRGGRIDAIDAGPSEAGEDLAGDYLLPGLVELHTDQVESHFQPRPKRFWDPIPAVVAHDAQMAASGVTTVFDALRIGSGPGDNRIAGRASTLVGALVQAADSGILRADHYVHLRCEVSTPDVIDVFDDLGESDRVRMVSLMDHTPGQRQYADIEAFRTYMVGKHNMSQGEFDEHVTELYALSAAYADTHRGEMAARARARGLRMAAHDDATIAHVAESSELGVHISEFPTTVEAARAAREAGQSVVMGAPNIVRGGSHSGNVAAAELLGAGLLDILSSDYVPASLLQAVFRIVSDDAGSIEDAVRLVSTNPAAAAGLLDRGAIATGLRGDLVRVSPYEGPDGGHVPIVRGVWREGVRVA